MKGIFKFMTVALAAGLVVSCSDDLGLDQAGKYAVGQQEGVGTIYQFESDLATRLAAQDDDGVGRAATKDFVWKSGEQVRVFTLEKLAQSIFKVQSGEGTNTATFTIVENAQLPLDAKTYAVTESEMVYGISAEPKANEKGETLPLLTLTIPSGRDILDSDNDGKDFEIINAWKPGAVGNGLRNFPIPFWGAAKIGGTEIEPGYYPEDPTLTTTVQSLTAALRINLKSLPAGTKYIVLTTHGGRPFDLEYSNQIDQMGFILADKITGNKDDYSTWYTPTDPNNLFTGQAKNPEWWITDGWSEPIAGTMRAILDPEKTVVAGAEKKDWPKLSPDPRLVPSDEMIIDIQGLDKNIIYVPILSRYGEYVDFETGQKMEGFIPYKNLHVIAAKQISEKYRYCYEGTELRNFQNFTFELNKLYNLDMGLVVMDKAHLDELNDAIKANCKDKDITTVINVGTFYAYNYDSWRNDTAIYVNVPGNVQLNLEKIVTIRRGKNFANPLTVTDLIKPAHSDRWSEDRVRDVEINVPNTWFKLAVTEEGAVYDGRYASWSKEQNLSSETPNYLKASKLNVVCGQSDVILGSVDGNKNSLVAVNVLASQSKLLKQPLQIADEVPIAENDPEMQAAIKVKHGFGRINIVNSEDGWYHEDAQTNEVTGTRGSVYIYTPANSEFETEIDTLDIENNSPGFIVRMDDALVYDMHFCPTNSKGNRTVVTVGSSAIGYIYDGRWDKGLYEYGNHKEHFDDAKGDWTAYEPIDEDVVNVDDQWYKENTGVTKLDLRSYWTGKALSVRAINAERGEYSELTYDSPVDPVYPTRSYDVRTVWTTAQLASVGEGVYASSLAKSNHDYVEGDLSKEVAPKVAVYNIPVALVKTMWLGGWDYMPYRWIGARARVNGFKLNGEGTELKNMSLLPGWPDGDKNWIIDPHWCCTSCWRNPVTPGSYLNVTEDIGLIRYIQNGDEVTVFNVHLNDPLLIMNPKDDHCCLWDAFGNTYNDKQPFRIDNVGAIVGRISTKKANVYDNMVGEVKIDMKFDTKTGVDGGRKIGGMVGYTQLGWTTNSMHAFADQSGTWYDTNITIGSGALDMHTNQVWGTKNDPSGFIVGYEFVGGLTGKIEKPTTAEIVKNTVRLKMGGGRSEAIPDPINIWAFNGHVGGLAGYFTSTQATKVNQNIVDCAEKIEADGGTFYGDYQGSWAGGLLGRAINVNAGDLELKVNRVRAAAIISGKSYVGGLIGDLDWEKDIVTVDDSKSFYNDDATVKSDSYMVDVVDSIMCKNTAAGGLFGRVTLGPVEKNYEYIMAAQVKTGLIKATKSWAGGLIGELESGYTYIGDEKFEYANRDRGVIVEVGKMASGEGVGGFVGTNVENGQAHIYINDGYSTTYRTPDNKRFFRTYSFIDVKDWERTAAPITREYYGTFGNVLGHMGDVFSINNDWSTYNELGYPYLFFVNDYLNADVKKKVGYQRHADQNHTEDLAQKFWGDRNGYIGWRSNQKYYIGGKNPEHQVAFEQLESDYLPTANIFYQFDASNPLCDWNTMKTKLQQNVGIHTLTEYFNGDHLPK